MNRCALADRFLGALGGLARGNWELRRVGEEEGLSQRREERKGQPEEFLDAPLGCLARPRTVNGFFLAVNGRKMSQFTGREPTRWRVSWYCPLRRAKFRLGTFAHSPQVELARA